MTKRTFWSKLNHDDARLAIDMMDDAEIGRWFRGWLAGAGGKEYSEDKVQSWPLEMRKGFADGKESFVDAEKYSQKQRDRINKRYQGSTTEHHGATTVESGRENATESLPSNSQQPTANNQQPEAISEQPKKQPSVVRDVVEYWNDSIKGTAFPSARHTDPRGRVIATRVKDPSWFDDFKKAVAYIKTDPFYQGAGNTSWVASIDYLLQAGKATELAEKSTARPMKSQTLKPQINGFTPEMYGGVNAPDQW